MNEQDIRDSYTITDDKLAPIIVRTECIDPKLVKRIKRLETKVVLLAIALMLTLVLLMAIL
jgi:hypothetical protein